MGALLGITRFPSGYVYILLGSTRKPRGRSTLIVVNIPIFASCKCHMDLTVLNKMTVIMAHSTYRVGPSCRALAPELLHLMSW